MIRGILFDKDDTLVRLEDFWREPIRASAAFAVREALGREDKEVARLLEQAAGFEDGTLIPESPVVAGTNQDILKAWDRILSSMGSGLAEPEQVNRFLEQSCRDLGQVVPTEPLAPLLDELISQGIKLAVATSDNFEPALHCLKSLEISQYFCGIYSADRVPRPKPWPDIALAFCRDWDLNPEDVAMVGDSENDMQFAENSGVVGIFYCPGKPSTPLPRGAKVGISHFSQLSELLSN